MIIVFPREDIVVEMSEQCLSSTIKALCLGIIEALDPIERCMR